MTAIAIGTSIQTKPDKAYEEAFTQILNNLSGQLPNFLFCFSTFNAEQIQLIAQNIKDKSPQALLVGIQSQAFTTEKRFTFMLYAIASQDIQANTRAFPLNVTSEGLPQTPESISNQTIIFISGQSETLNNLMQSLILPATNHSVIGSVTYGPDSWVLLNDSVFNNMAIRIDLLGIEFKSSPWHISIPLGLPQSFNYINNVCELIDNQPASQYYQRYLNQPLSGFSSSEQQQIFHTYPLCFQDKQSLQIIAPIMTNEQEQLILPISPSPSANIVTLALENPNFPDDMITQITTNLPAENQTPLLFTSAVRNFPTFINNREQQLFVRQNYPTPIRISSHGLIFNSNKQPPIYTSHARLLLITS